MKKQLYRVYITDGSNRRTIYVVAKSEDAALEKARKEYRGAAFIDEHLGDVFIA